MLFADPQLQLALAALLSLITGASLSYLQAQRSLRRLTAEQERLLHQQQQSDHLAERLSAERDQLREQLRDLESTRTELALAQQALGSQQQHSQERQLTLQQQLQQRQERLEQLHAEQQQHRQQQAVHLQDHAELGARFEAQQQQLEQNSHSLQQLEQAVSEKTEENQRLHLQVAEVEARHAEKSAALERQLVQFDTQKNTLKTEFEHLASKIFEARGQQLNQQNQHQLDSLLGPLRQQLQSFHTEVRDIHHKETQQQSALSSELRQLKALNQQMTCEAHQLATALKGQKKMQGNWGELILENVLDRAGLINGQDYRREVSLQNVEGQRQRPDAIVYLPEKKHLIIDAKVSLNAYTRFVNSDNDAERQAALNEHVSAFSARIKELADRNYFELPGLNSPELVFMFVPIESAFVAAVQADEQLFLQALEQNVLVATPTTLLTSLNIVRQLWRFEDQNRHSAELANKAAKIYDKLRGFVGSMEGLGKQLDSAQQSYQKALGQLCSGRGNLIKQASEFKQLGVAVKQELPEHLQERAALELEQVLVNELEPSQVSKPAQAAALEPVTKENSAQKNSSSRA